MNNTTSWLSDVDLPSYPSFSGSKNVDTVVIGGGITGITIAYMLAKRGKSVVVLEKESLVESVTACTTAFLTRSLDTDIPTLERIYGSSIAVQALRAHEDAIDTVERIIREESIECGFVRVPNYLVALSKGGWKSVQKEHERAIALGFSSEIVSSSTFPFPNKGGVLTPHQARFHPLKYLAGLRRAAEKLGTQFFDRSEVKSIKGKIPITVILEKGSVSAQSVVIATYNPFVQPWWYRLKKGMYTSYVLELSIPQGSLPHALYEDDGNPYTYFRAEPGEGGRDRLIIGGEDHRRELKLDPDRAYNRLLQYATETLSINDARIVRKWDGPILEQSDGLALIGRYSDHYPNRYVATAFSGNGMTYATISGMLISDLIEGKENVWEKIYRPNRPISLWAILLKGRDYMQEFFNGVSSLLTSSKKAPQ